MAMALTRRELIRNSAYAGVGVAVLGRLGSVFGGSPAYAATSELVAGYGPLLPDPAGRLDLPRGFSYQIVTQTGDRLKGAPGLVPGSHDGSATFAAARDQTFLVQNHEQDEGSDVPVVAPSGFVYDPGAEGGTTTMLVDPSGTVVQQYVSLGGTNSNCAGGRTPWGTWLTCEETDQRAEGRYTKDHGFVFEVSPREPNRNRDPFPLTALGRFEHEAVCVDPNRGCLYLTEDASEPNGLFYRFSPKRLPSTVHSLRAGGLLEAMHVPGLPDLSMATEIGATHRVRWKAVPDPLAAVTPTRMQLDPITRSRKLEGTWWGNGRVYFVCSYARRDDGSAKEHDGQVWTYDPVHERIRLEVLFAVNRNPGSDKPDGPDNTSVSPYGGLLLAEDGEGVQHLLGVTPDSETFLLARNTLNDSEFTGPVFSPDAKTLFVNVQDPGIVYAIRGPWRRAGGLA